MNTKIFLKGQVFVITKHKQTFFKRKYTLSKSLISLRYPNL